MKNESNEPGQQLNFVIECANDVANGRLDRLREVLRKFHADTLSAILVVQHQSSADLLRPVLVREGYDNVRLINRIPKRPLPGCDLVVWYDPVHSFVDTFGEFVQQQGRITFPNAFHCLLIEPPVSDVGSSPNSTKSTNSTDSESEGLYCKATAQAL